MKMNEIIKEDPFKDGLIDLWNTIKSIFSSNDQDTGPSLPAWLESIIDVANELSVINFKVDKDGSVNLSSSNNDLKSSKLALEELKLLKKAISIEKKQFSLERQSIRQSHADDVANQHALLPGMGKFGTAYRYAARATRAAKRAGVNDAVQSYNSIIRSCDLLLKGLDQLQLAIEKEILTGNYKPVSQQTPSPVNTTDDNAKSKKEPVKQQPKPPAQAKPKPEPVKQQPKPSAQTKPKPEPVKQQPKPSAQTKPKPEPVKQQPKPSSGGRFAFNPLGR